MGRAGLIATIRGSNHLAVVTRDGQASGAAADGRECVMSGERLTAHDPDLVDALRACAGAAGLEIGEVTGDGPEAVAVSGHGAVTVERRLGERDFAVTVAVPGRGRYWAQGSTADLTAAAGVAAAWRSGCTLAELHARFPFMVFDALAQAWESGDPVATMWGLLLEDPDLARIRPLLRAAHGDERLRRRMPSVSHFALSFPADGGAGDVTIVPLSNGRFVVELGGEAVPTDDTAAAVSLAARGR